MITDKYTYLEMRHDVEVITHNKLYSVSHTIDFSISYSTSDLHRIYVNGYYCV